MGSDASSNTSDEDTTRWKPAERGDGGVTGDHHLTHGALLIHNWRQFEKKPYWLSSLEIRPEIDA